MSTNALEQGKVSQAMRFIDNNSNIKGVHEITENVMEKLKMKHPAAQEPHQETLLEDKNEIPETVIFEEISIELVQSVTKHIQGSGGPTKVDADFFKHIICSKFYGNNTINLCQAIVDLTKRLATESLNPECLRHFVSCRLIPLMKDTDTNEVHVRPIGIGEVIRRITGKCITTILKLDIQDMAAKKLPRRS